MSKIEFGPVETITVAALEVGDFIVQIPPQQGQAGKRVDSGVRDLRDDWGTWTRSYTRRGRFQIRSRVIMLNDPKASALNLPAEFVVEVRRPDDVLDTSAVDDASNADELLTALFDVPEDMRAYALAGRGLAILRATADLCGVGDADTLSKRAAIAAIVDNF